MTKTDDQKFSECIEAFRPMAEAATAVIKALRNESNHMTCTRCESTGFLNLHQIPNDVLVKLDETGEPQVILDWMKANVDHDVTVCDCCGDGEHWHNLRGEHDHKDNGPSGPYAYNGGLPECN